ncbi:i/LWEQ domain-containing protein [Phthorimaea operculella]|nr:i/LWEQ domain-containing protein [Phthorimaea operculella]
MIIRLAVVELGESVSELIKAGGQCRLASNAHNQRLVADNAKHTNEKVVGVLSALQAGARGTQACIDAAATIASIIGDLDTTILFASAGTLHSEKETDTFSDHRENILKTAKTLVEDTKTLVGGAAGTQEQLAAAAQSAVRTIVQLCEVVKQGAMSLGSSNPEPQVLLLHAARDVASALRDLAAATTAASGKHVAHPDMQTLKHAAKRDKRWSMPVKQNSLRLKRLSLQPRDSCDSETDFMLSDIQSDQEEELLKLLDYSSQDDDVSPTIFHDDAEEVISYIEKLMKYVPKKEKDDNLNERYNLAARNSLVDMDWRVLKYGENILLGEVKKLVDFTVDFGDRSENKRKRDMLKRLKASSDLDKEMNRLSQVIEDLDSEVEDNNNNKPTEIIPVEIVPQKKPKIEETTRLKSPVFKVNKVKPVTLDVKSISPDIIIDEPKSPSPEKVKTPSPEKVILPSPEKQKDKDESTEIIVKPETITKRTNTITKEFTTEFWRMFKDDSEWWKALAKRNLEKMEETRRELERFSGHELVLEEFHKEINKYEKEKETLQSFIDEVDHSKDLNKDLEYDKKYEDMVLKLIEFAKKDFIFKGFDPLIEQLKALSNIEIGARKKKIINIQDIINIYTQIDISKYTYEELCLLEKYYKEIIRKYKQDNNMIVREKENIVPRENRSRSPSLIREDTKSAPPSYHRNVILNVHSSHNLTKNINHYSSTYIPKGDTNRSDQRNSQIEIFDLTRTYPEEYYANNWWSIYEDILKSREHQFGSIDNWWNFYEAILNKKDTSDEELKRIRAVVQYRNSLRQKRPHSRMEEQLRMLDEIKNDRFKETEDVKTANQESVMVTNVTSLLKTVKAVEDEHTRGIRALESTIEALSQEIEVLMSPTPPKSTATPEELVRCTRQMTVATARAVSAGNSNKQDQLTAAANLGRKTVIDLLVACKVSFRWPSIGGAVSLLERGIEMFCWKLYSDTRQMTVATARAVSAGNSNKQDQLTAAANLGRKTVIDLLVACKSTIERQHYSQLVQGRCKTLQMTVATARAVSAGNSNKQDQLTAAANLGRKTVIDLLVACKMTVATARAVSAGNSNKQDQLTAAANLGRKTVIDLLVACKAAAFTAESAELQSRTVEAGRQAATAYRSLLQAVLAACNGDSNARQSFPELSRRVAHTVADIIAAAELLKGSDWVDPDDPTVIAENELLGAAASIDAAAKKLDSLRPRKSVAVQEADESLNFDEMILEAAKSIITATSALVRAASAAQRELIDQGKVARRPTSSSDDGQWSEGLISAARLVAAAAHSLVEAANALVQGAGSEERLISSARQVASSTAQLLVACKVKADPSSESTRRLQAAGAEVIRSTDNLVRAARDAIQCEEERSLVLNRRMVGGIAQEIDARSEVLRIEKELEEARGRLTAIRQAKYKLRTGDTSGEDTDYAGYYSDASGPQTKFKTPNSSFQNTTYSPNSTYSTHNTTQNTHNTTNLSHHVSQLNQSIHGTPYSPGYNQSGPGYTPTSPGYNQSGPGYAPTSPGYNQSGQGYTATSPGYNQSGPGYATSPGYTQTGQNTQSYTQNVQSTTSFGQGGAQSPANGYSRQETYTVQSPSFSSFRPQDEHKQNYEGFTTRSNAESESSVVVKSLQLPELRKAYLPGSHGNQSADITVVTETTETITYETRLYDTPRPAEFKTEEQKQFESQQYYSKERFGYEAPKTPLSPKFNARELKFDDKPEPIYSSLKKPLDGVGQTFTEHQKSTEAIPGGVKQSEYTIKSESYSSYPKVDITKTVNREEIKSPFTSTPFKTEKSSASQFSQQTRSEFQKTGQELVKVPTPEFERISSPYGKEVHSYGGPNYMEETTTEVKEIPNGTQKITTTKVYSSSPVNITSTNTKYEPIKLEGIDELSKSFDNDSRYSTLDSRFNTLDSKMSSDTSRSFMRPSEFQSQDYQSTTNVTKIKKPSELVKEIDSLDKKFAKSTITSETIERKSVMTSSHKSESSSTVTKKFGNF